MKMKISEAIPPLLRSDEAGKEVIPIIRTANKVLCLDRVQSNFFCGVMTGSQNTQGHLNENSPASIIYGNETSEISEGSWSKVPNKKRQRDSPANTERKSLNS